MMRLSLKVACCFLLLLCSGKLLLAQDKRSYELDGYMGVQGGASFNYNLQLKDSTGPFLSGYSYTYQVRGKVVKTYLSAEINKAQKTLRIKEQAIIYNHGFKSDAVICLVEALLTYDKDQGVLSGPLITKTVDNGRSCSSGSLSFSNKEQIKALFAPTAPVTEKAAKDNIAQKTNTDPDQQLQAYFEHQQPHKTFKPIAQIEKKGRDSNKVAAPKSITEGENGTYLWTSDKIIFNIWDGGTEDDDRVDVFYNGKKVLANYTLKNKKKELILAIGGNQLNIISIFAINEGNKPPNTANISIQDGSKTYDIIAHNTVGKKAILMIKKQ